MAGADRREAGEPWQDHIGARGLGNGCENAEAAPLASRSLTCRPDIFARRRRNASGSSPRRRDSARAKALLGAIAAKTGRTAQAIEILSEVVALDGRSTRAKTELAMLLRRQGKADDALPLLPRSSG